MKVSIRVPWRLALGALALGAALVSPSGSHAETFWALELGGPNFRIIDRVTGRDVGNVSTSVTGRWRGIAVHPATGILYASETEYLYAISKVTGTTTQIGLFGSELVRDLTFDQVGQLYGVTGNNGASTNSLHTIDSATGAATLLFPLNGNRGHGIAHDPLDPGTLYHLADGIFERVDLGSGTITPIGLSGDPILSFSLGLEHDDVAGIFRFFDDAGRYYTIDRNGMVTATGSQNPTVYFGLAFDDEDFELPIFADGFESGTTNAWSQTVPPGR